MKKINIEKELNKIQYGNRNKIILGICTLLLIIAVGSTYALYQVRHTNKLVFNTVGEFKKKDIIISVKLDDKEESIDSFPQKEDGYVYSHMECEKNNITNITWDEEHWKLNADINGQDKCTVYFVKSPFHMKSCENKSMADCLLEEGQKFTNILAFVDPDSNARYYGKDPSNYIWFNCDDYNFNTTSEVIEKHCEKWRVIGAFNKIKKVVERDTTEDQNLVKIIRNETIGNIVWDSSNLNDWTNASLQKTLNSEEANGYLNQNYNNSIKGITPNTKEMIEKVEWNLGGWNHASLTANDFYVKERGSTTYNGQPNIWHGYIGLMYPSDYGYAAGSDCLTTNLYNYGSSCKNRDWLFNNDYQWTLTSFNSLSYNVFQVIGNGESTVDSGTLGSGRASGLHGVRPTLYLTHDTKISGGDGTYENPYTIAIQ